MKTIEVQNLADLSGAVEQILPYIEDKRIVAFYGKMGAGKTTTIKEICKQLGVVDIVCSPTFALVNEYFCNDGDSVFHFDFYRIDKIEEAYDLGYQEYFDSGKICLIEWPEKIEELLPNDILRVNIEENDSGKRVFILG